MSLVLKLIARFIKLKNTQNKAQKYLYQGI